jgi:hypothetical protein
MTNYDPLFLLGAAHHLHDERHDDAKVAPRRRRLSRRDARAVWSRHSSTVRPAAR